MNKFIKEYSKLPIYFDDDGINYRISMVSNTKGTICIDIDINNVPENHSQYENWKNYSAIDLRHNRDYFQGYLFSSSNFKNEKEGLEAIKELLEFAKEYKYEQIYENI